MRPASETHYDVSVVTSGHDVADARLHRIVGALVRAGLTVEVLGMGESNTGPAGADVRTTARGSFTQRALLAITLPWRARGKVIICLDPDAALGCVVVRTLRRRKLVVDVHEDYAAVLGDRPWATGARGWLARRMVNVASTVAARADLTVVADEHVPPAANRSRQRLVVRNVPDLALMGSPSGKVESGRRAVYVGDVRRSRGARAMVEALAVAPEWTLDVIGPVSTADAQWLEARVADPGLAGRVRLHGRQPPAVAWEIARGAAVGLALLEDTPAFRAAMPTKIQEYLAAGMAVLATPLPRIEKLLAESGGGVVVSSAREAGQTLRHWSATESAELGRIRAAAQAWSNRLNEVPSPYDELAGQIQQLCRQ